MKKYFYISLFTIALSLQLQSQEEKKDFGIKFSGFVKSDFFYDTRQTVDAREGHFLLYPANEKLDKAGEDINAKSSYNFLAIQSRLKGTITGPDAFGAKTSGAIEGAFFGHSNSDINGFRLRHAFVKLNWENTELIMGQYWNPFFITGCFASTVAFNTGTPFQFLSRNPQVRITYKMGNINLIGAALSQRDFASYGGSTPLRNSGIPDIHAQIHFKSEDKLLAGIGGAYKSIVPRLVTDSSYKTTESVNGISAVAFIKYKTEPITFKVYATYTENGYDGLQLGGYAVKKTTDVLKNYKEYTTINTMSAWTDIHTNGKKTQAGILIGYSKNLGSKDDIEAGEFYSRGSNIAYLYRIQPRVVFNSGKTRIAFEPDYTVAAYGTPNSNGVVENTKTISNIRLLVGVFYFF